MIEYKQGVQAFFPVRLLDVTGTPVTGKVYTDVTVAIMKSNGTELVKSLSVGDLIELSTGAWAGNGAYRLKMSASDLDTPGMIMYVVHCSGAVDYDGTLKVVANEEVDTFTAVGGVQTTATAINTKLGAPAGASVSADIAGNLTAINSVNTKLGAPAGASVSADIAAVKSDTGAINTNTADLETKLTRALGLMHENSVLDNTVFDGGNNLTQARMRIYDSKAHAQAATGTGLVATYTITATYLGTNVTTYTVVLEP